AGAPPAGSAPAMASMMLGGFRGGGAGLGRSRLMLVHALLRLGGLHAVLGDGARAGREIMGRGGGRGGRAAEGHRGEEQERLFHKVGSSVIGEGLAGIGARSSARKMAKSRRGAT